jgi:hypothetical protein
LSQRIEGIGLGLRWEIAEAMHARGRGDIAWVEIHPENFIDRGGRFEQMLADAAAVWPIVPHGLTLGFGSLEPYDKDYLCRLRTFLEDIRAPWYSDHLCWVGSDGIALHDLLPLPFTHDAVALACDRIAELEDAIGIPVAVENISYYVHPGPAEMDEIEFLLEVLDRSGCRMMLDVNNVYVNSRNHGFDPRAYLDRIPADRVVQIHVAGHLVRPGMPIIDTHGEPVCEEVFALLGHALRRIGPVPVLLERDANFPEWNELARELRRLRAIADEAARMHSEEAPRGGSGGDSQRSSRGAQGRVEASSAAPGATR